MLRDGSTASVLAIVHFGSLGASRVFLSTLKPHRAVLDSTHIYHTAIQHWVDRQAPYGLGGPSGGAIDPALLESGLKLPQRSSYFIDSVGDALLLLQAATLRAFSAIMVLTSTLER